MDWRVSQIREDLQGITIYYSTLLYSIHLSQVKTRQKPAVHQLAAIIDRQCGGNHKPKL